MNNKPHRFLLTYFVKSRPFFYHALLQNLLFFESRSPAAPNIAAPGVSRRSNKRCNGATSAPRQSTNANAPKHTHTFLTLLLSHSKVHRTPIKKKKAFTIFASSLWRLERGAVVFFRALSLLATWNPALLRCGVSSPKREVPDWSHCTQTTKTPPWSIFMKVPILLTYFLMGINQR